MSIRTVAIVFLALTCGVSAIYLFARPAPAAPQTETVPVLVAAVDIQPLTVLTADHVKTRDFPKDMAPEGAMSNVDDVLGRPVLSSLVKGETLFGPKLASRGAGLGLSSRIPKGKRAFTITMPSVQDGVAGFVLPGNHVDVLMTSDGRVSTDAKLNGVASTVVLLQNMEVLAVEQKLEAPSENRVDPNQLKSVTFLVTPLQASKLQLGQSKGKLSLTLRNVEDKEAVSAVPVYLSELYGETPREEPKPEAKAAAAVA
jgi:pilus assembly protein CpaB